MRRLGKEKRDGRSLCSCSTKDGEDGGRNVNVYGQEGGGREERVI